MPTHGPDLSRLSVSQLAALTGFDRRTVRERLRGLEPVEATGRELRFDAPAALAQLYTGDALELNRERARLAAAQAERIERQNAIERGELVPAGVVEDWLVQVLSRVVQRLRPLPSKAAPEAHGAATIAAVEAVLRRHLDEAMTLIAEAKWIAPPRRARAAPAEAE